ncbi:amidase [Vreelandella arcis]|uniref:Aspartyl-tRNA(Asn)/glutamyl-tRNA(Gln) amidotransferase subunit A n=1 Tax=Vreelandella arcis TaxID=416873 RepID=A0A1G9YB27_9GAMM|nr:amidase [Halomonas arcis]SDN05735.1 aspartyl-tRNA(Asn)/glutamyl-tRNA(Gln) amidotransferase subunit A [Halomonas arcis]
MSDTDLGIMDAQTLRRLFESRQASPLDATRAALARIDRFNEAVNAYVYVDAEGAEEAAKASAKRWEQGKPLSAIDGIPVSMKDLTQVAGMPCHSGSLTSPIASCDTDAPPAQMLRDAGAIFLGKTNTPEFGWKAVTDNRVFGATYNPWNTQLTPGGSSGGAAVAAALNMGVLHQGGDSGGSIRIPAAFTGVFGFKPTFGWTPQWPPAQEPTLSHLGPLTRSVRDAVSMLNVMGRYNYRDPYATRGQPDCWGVDLDKGIKGLRIAYSKDLGYASVDPQIARRVKEAALKMEALGAEIVEIDPGFSSPLDIFRKIWFTASLYQWQQLDQSQREQLDPGMATNARKAEAWSALDLFRALSERALLTRQLEHFNQQYHLIMTPAVSVLPFEVNQEVPPGSGMRDWEEWAPFSYPFNLSQQPAASVPCGFTDNGLPVGFQLAGGKYDDVRVLRACHAFMEAHPPRFPTEPNPSQYT